MLMELAVALAVMGALAGVTYSAMGSMAEANERRRMELLVQSMRSELLEFAATHNRFPCPSVAGTGDEGDGSGNCPAGAKVGSFPYRALGRDQVAIKPGYVFRYGVLRDEAVADLARTAPSTELSPVSSFRKVALAAVNASKAGQPFIPVVTNVVGDCSSIGETPAVVLSIGPPETVGSGICFPASLGNDIVMASIGRQELAGWLVARARGSAG